MPNYKFYLKCDSADTVYTTGSDHLLSDKAWHQFYPGVDRNNAVEYDIWDHKYRKKMKGELTFLNNQLQTDYTYLSQINNTSAEISFRIEQSCGATTASDWWEGYFSIIDGSWDADRGLFTVTPTPDDEYRLLEEWGDKEYNIMTLSHTLAEIMTYATVTVTIVSTQVLLGTSHLDFENANPNYPNTYRGTFNDLWSYYAECSYTEDGADPGYYFLIWKKQVSRVKLDDTYVYDGQETCFSSPSCTAGANVTLNARGILLHDVIAYIVNAISGLDYKSSFFQNDAEVDGTPVTVNYVTGLANKLTRLVLYQKSDIKPTSDPATIGNMNFNDLMQWLKDMFNVDWFVDSNGDFRIEHWSYFETTYGSDIDLTLLDSGKWAYHKNKWSYEIQEMPNIERFSFMEAHDFDFLPNEITYDRVATFNRYKDNVKERTLPITTDLAFAYSTPDSISNEGWILLQTNASDYVENETGLYFGAEVVNAHLSWSALHDKYWRHGRIIANGTINGVDVTFASHQRNIKQTDITYPECCGTFDPLAYKITGLGEGQVREAEYKLIDGTVKTVFFYLDVNVSSFPKPETYYILINGHDRMLANNADKLIWYG